MTRLVTLTSGCDKAQKKRMRENKHACAFLLRLFSEKFHKRRGKKMPPPFDEGMRS